MLGPLEESVLAAVAKLKPHAYSINILLHIEEISGKDVNLGALFTTLKRMEKKGFVSQKLGEPTPERGGRAKRYYEITQQGWKELDIAFDRSNANQAMLKSLSYRGGILSSLDKPQGW